MPAALSELDASIVKGMLLRGDRQHDIASWFGVNAGRVAEVKTGARHRQVVAAPMHALPPPGPYSYFTEAKNGEGQSSQQALERILATFDLKWSRELATAAHERRQTNEKIDMLTRQLLELRRHLNIVEPPIAPVATRRRPLKG